MPGTYQACAAEHLPRFDFKRAGALVDAALKLPPLDED
jgi:hypothetical protein